jgi:hypothetical protein
MTGMPRLAVPSSATVSSDSAPVAGRRAAVIALWQMKQLDTVDIAGMLESHKAEVE